MSRRCAFHIQFNLRETLHTDWKAMAKTFQDQGASNEDTIQGRCQQDVHSINSQQTFIYVDKHFLVEYVLPRCKECNWSAMHILLPCSLRLKHPPDYYFRVFFWSFFKKSALRIKVTISSPSFPVKNTSFNCNGRSVDWSILNNLRSLNHILLFTPSNNHPFWVFCHMPSRREEKKMKKKKTIK